MGAFVVVALALWCFTGVLGDETNALDCSRYQRATGNGLIACTKIYAPVCGTDDNTYSNECELCRHNQESKKNVGLKYEGQCIQIQEYCKDYSPDQAFCTLELMPHCGSDGKVYDNKCNFCVNALKSQGALSLQHFGRC